MWAVLFTGICFFESEPPPAPPETTQACENANDPRCAVQPAAPAPSQLTQLKHAPDMAWIASVPAYSKAAYVLVTNYAGKALAGFKSRPKRPPRHA